MSVGELFRSGYILWGVFLVIALGFLLSSFTRYQRTGSRRDLPRVYTDVVATLLVVAAVIHLGFGVPLPIPLLVVYGVVLLVPLVARWRVVNQLYAEQEAAMEARAAANRAARDVEPRAE